MASLSKGTSFSDGVTGDVTAAKLHALVDSATPVGGLITDRTAKTSIAAADVVLISDSADSNNLKKVTVANVFNTLPTAKITTGTIDIATLGTTTGTTATLTNASITTGTIATATLGSTIGTAATFTTSTLGTATATAANITNGTVQTLTSSTLSSNLTGGTFSGLVGGSINSSTGTISNFSTTLSGDLTISAGAATVGTRVAVVNTVQEYSRTHNFDATTLTSGTSIAWDLSQNQVARLSLSTNGTMADATNKVDGATYILIVTQGTGSNTLAWNATYKWPSGTAPTLTTGFGKSDIFTFVSNGTSLFGVASQNYS